MSVNQVISCLPKLSRNQLSSRLVAKVVQESSNQIDWLLEVVRESSNQLFTEVIINNLPVKLTIFRVGALYMYKSSPSFDIYLQYMFSTRTVCTYICNFLCVH